MTCVYIYFPLLTLTFHSSVSPHPNRVSTYLYTTTHTFAITESTRQTCERFFPVSTLRMIQHFTILPNKKRSCRCYNIRGTCIQRHGSRSSKTGFSLLQSSSYAHASRSQRGVGEQRRRADGSNPVWTKVVMPRGDVRRFV